MACHIDVLEINEDRILGNFWML